MFGQLPLRKALRPLAATSVLAGLIAALGAPIAVAEESRRALSFALIGDTPYDDLQVTQLDRVIADINADRDVRFVLHAGDIKGGATPCTDEMFQTRLDQLQTFERPVVYTPGDNEWTDCHREGAGRFDPIERLTRLRELFFAEPGRAIGGRYMGVRTQASEPGFETFVENVLFVRRRTVFSTIHVVGSNNDLAPWSGIDPDDSFESPRPDRLAEFEARQAAALAWLDETFDVAEARDAAVVFVLIHANPQFELEASDDGRAGFDAFLERLTELTVLFGKPVVLAHGDFHFLLIDNPQLAQADDGTSRRLLDLTRIQTFGSPDVQWIKVTIEPELRREDRVKFEPVVLSENQSALLP